MPIGNSSTVSVTGLNQEIGEIAAQWRAVADRSTAFFGAINKIGVGGLESVGFAAPDATEFFSEANGMQTLAQVYFGIVAQTPPFNFDDDFAQARGPQTS